MRHGARQDRGDVYGTGGGARAIGALVGEGVAVALGGRLDERDVSVRTRSDSIDFAANNGVPCANKRTEATDIYRPNEETRR